MSPTQTAPSQEVFLPETLVAYKGGGWDGCLWEWNYCYFDQGGQFCDIYHSGWFGCETYGELRERYTRHPRDFEFYTLSDPEEVARFARREPLSWVLVVAEWFAEQQDPVEQSRIFAVLCRCCQELRDILHGDFRDYEGVGGVMLDPQEFVCSDCFGHETSCGESHD